MYPPDLTLLGSCITGGVPNLSLLRTAMLLYRDAAAAICPFIGIGPDVGPGVSSPSKGPWLLGEMLRSREIDALRRCE